MKYQKFLIPLLFFMIISLSANAQKKSKNKKCCSDSNPPTFNQDSIVKINSELASITTSEFLKKYFTTEVNADGKTIYKPIVVTIEHQIPVLQPGDSAVAEPTVTYQTVKIEVPLATLAPITNMVLKELEIDHHGRVSKEYGLAPLPYGVTTLLNKLNSAIQPEQIN